VTAPRVLIKSRADRDAWELYYLDPLAGKRRRRLFRGTRREAERAAAVWEHELANTAPTTDCSWEVARERFTQQHLAGKNRRTCEAYISCLNAFEKWVGKPARLSLVGPSTLADLVARMRAAKLSHARQSSVLRHLRVFFRWCVRMEYLGRAPDYKMQSAPRGQSKAKGRPISLREFAAVLRAVRQVVGQRDGRAWRRLLVGLWLSGLRLGEALRLSWDAGPVRIDLAGEYPSVLWGEGGQKNQQHGLTVIAPDFARWLLRIPLERRRGPVFPLGDSRRPAIDRASRIISAIGEASGIIYPGGHTPTAHDLRRSFGTRWALRLPPAALCSLMRHASIATTMAYYVDLQATGEIGRLLYPDRK
jgi:integrase